MPEGIRFYYIQVKNFFIKGLDLGSVPIYITFDTRFRKMLLGMDIIRLMNVDIDHDEQMITFSLSYLR